MIPNAKQRIKVEALRSLDDGTFLMATAMPDMPGQDGGYVILSHLKISSMDFEYKKEGPQPWMLKGWNIDSIEAAIPELKVLGTKIVTRWEYDNGKYQYPEQAVPQIEKKP
jgi:hypothetical protein